MYVGLNPVPTSNAGWTNAPFEAQYLKLYDVTPPPAPASVGIGSTNTYVFTNVVTFSWPAVSDPEGGVSAYQVLSARRLAARMFSTASSPARPSTVTNSFGPTHYAIMSVVNNAGVEGPFEPEQCGRGVT